MTEFEFLEAGVLYSERILDSAMNLITVVFAYLAASHFVGRQLPKIVVVSLSIVYSIWIFGTMAAIAGFLDSTFNVRVQYGLVFPDGWIYPNEPRRVLWFAVSLTPMTLAWFGSLLYLHIIVRGRSENA